MIVVLPDDFDLTVLRTEAPIVFTRTRFVDVGVGWLPTIRQFVADAQRSWPELAIEGIRQKFGSMQIECSQSPAEVRDEIALATALAEARSMRRCECCGAPGVIRQPPESRRGERLACRCDVHSTERQRAWRRPAFYDRGEIHVRGVVYRYVVEDDCLEFVDPPLGTLPSEWRYPR